MRLEMLELENVCQHRKLKHVWHPGLNGIVGPNGSGKSNIVKAIKFAITGGFDNAGTKDENIYQLARDKARARVTLAFEHDGVKAEVIRTLRGGTSSCRIGGGAAVEGDNAVTAALLEFLGVDKRILSEYIFVPQRHMAGFVDETPAERNRTFGQLFDLAKAEAIYRMLDAAIKRINPAQPSPEIEPLKVRIAETKERHKGLTTDVNTAKGRLQKLDEAAAKKLISRSDAWAVGQGLIDERSRQVDTLAGELEVAQGELAAAEAEQAKLTTARDEAAGDLAAAREALTTWETVRLRRQREEVLTKRQADLDAEPAAHPEPQPPKEYPGEKVMETKLAEMNGEMTMRKDLIAKFRDKPGVCPTCGSETTAILAKVKSYEQEMTGMEALLTLANKLQKAYVTYGREHARWQQWSEEHVRKTVSLTSDWVTFKAGAMAEPAADPDSCRAVIDAGEGLERALIEADTVVVQLRKTVNQRAGALDQVSTTLLKLRNEQMEQPNPAEVAKARRVIDMVGPVKEQLARAEGELAAVAKGLDSDGKMLKRLEEAEQKAETDRLWAYQLGEVRKVMHHDQLPKLVAHNYLEILADDTNELLESFDADFTVGLGEGLNFAATFLHGPYAGTVSPAQRLSEGQKVILALAFRVAVNSLFAGMAGLLCLDEPTESLDERNLGCLEVAIGRMRDLSQSRGIQCLLVTHEPSFESLFDGVLRLVA
jgi:DNA repair exonuclease SbcCD ATPase subunit